jgi:hypothetical protein
LYQLRREGGPTARGGKVKLPMVPDEGTCCKDGFEMEQGARLYAYKDARINIIAPDDVVLRDVRHRSKRNELR